LYTEIPAVEETSSRGLDWDWLKVFPAKKTVDIIMIDVDGINMEKYACIKKLLWNKSGNDSILNPVIFC
jgi:hypothetical protein